MLYDCFIVVLFFGRCCCCRITTILILMHRLPSLCGCLMLFINILFYFLKEDGCREGNCKMALTYFLSPFVIDLFSSSLFSSVFNYVFFFLLFFLLLCGGTKMQSLISTNTECVSHTQIFAFITMKRHVTGVTCCCFHKWDKLQVRRSHQME